ncbi:hypothetical protein M3194_18330 [Paenibacillus glycanilyticus]|uniref:hypothetical protein n=1 Tax=Paenibacillus glycanilyticus TaxID=126569 RepID=UPI00203BE228|nr:hypothetical protein [Paenibacillus glycanilyticus]MCM3629307.1 hypothetical protein [Paenibacillus glycanilyticus]
MTNMYICFAEYKIAAADRTAYLNYTGTLMKESDKIQLYEGTDQLNLFVEIWTAATEEEAEAIKKERCDERSPWYRIAEWIPGGADKMHVWTFKPAGAGPNAG